jgi:hypothetical protein
VINCGKATIIFLKTGYVFQCQRGIKGRFSAASRPEKTPNFFEEFSKVFLLQKLIFLLLLQEINHTITLLDTKMDSNPWIFTVSNKYIPKYE